MEANGTGNDWNVFYMILSLFSYSCRIYVLLILLYDDTIRTY